MGCVSQPEHTQGFLYSLASNTFLKILAVPNVTEFWIVSIEMLMSSISRCAESLVGIVPSAPTTIGTTLHLTPHSLLSSLHSSLYFSIFLSSLVVTLVSPGTTMSTIRHSLLSLFRIMISGLLASITRSVKTLKSQNNFTLSFSLTFSALCWYHCSLCSRPCFFARPIGQQSPLYHALLCTLTAPFCYTLKQCG